MPRDRKTGPKEGPKNKTEFLFPIYQAIVVTENTLLESGGAIEWIGARRFETANGFVPTTVFHCGNMEMYINRSLSTLLLCLSIEPDIFYLLARIVH